MRYPTAERDDSIHQGRMIILTVAVTYLVFWLFEFFAFPIFLVPGFLYDRSLATLLRLIGVLFQFWTIGIFSILVWAGFGWARYVLGYFLLVTGLYHLVFGMMAEAGGGINLVVGAIGVASAAGLLLSLSVEKYVESRRGQETPWLAMGLALAGLLVILLAAAGIELAQTRQLVQVDRAERAYAGKILQDFAPALDPAVVDRVASDKLRQDMEASDFADQCLNMRQGLGDFQRCEEVRPASVGSILMHPEQHGDLVSFNVHAYYVKRTLLLELFVNTTTDPYVVTNVYFETLPGEKTK